MENNRGPTEWVWIALSRLSAKEEWLMCLILEQFQLFPDDLDWFQVKMLRFAVSFQKFPYLDISRKKTYIYS